VTRHSFEFNMSGFLCLLGSPSTWLSWPEREKDLSLTFSALSVELGTAASLSTIPILRRAFYFSLSLVPSSVVRKSEYVYNIIAVELSGLPQSLKHVIGPK
jgi:hypothetical protein